MQVPSPSRLRDPLPAPSVAGGTLDVRAYKAAIVVRFP